LKIHVNHQHWFWSPLSKMRCEIVTLAKQIEGGLRRF